MATPGNTQFNGPQLYGPTNPETTIEPIEGAKNIWVGARAFIWSYDGNMYEVTDDIVDGGINRPTNEPMTLNLTINNQGDKYRQMFIPMDRIIIFLRRDQTEYQAFTGYITQTPVFNLVTSQQISIQAEDLIRRLKQKYWDPNLPENVISMSSPRTQASMITPDMTLAYLMTAPEHLGLQPDHVFIQKFPDEWAERAIEITELNKACMTQWKDLIVCPDPTDGNCYSGGDGGSGGNPPSEEQAEVAAWLAGKMKEAGLPEPLAIMTALVETEMRTGPDVRYKDQDSAGPYQIRVQLHGWKLEDAEDWGYSTDNWFIKNAEQYKGQYGDTAAELGAWCQKVQGSAFPDKYAARYQDAMNLIEQSKGGANAYVNEDGLPKSTPRANTFPSNLTSEAAFTANADFSLPSEGDGDGGDSGRSGGDGGTPCGTGNTGYGGTGGGGGTDNGVWWPHVAEVNGQVESQFPVNGSTYEGHGTRGAASAVDWVVPPGWGSRANSEGKRIGDGIVSWLASNASDKTDYIIWNGKINNGSGWRPYDNSGYWVQGDPDTDAHYDHVHWTALPAGSSAEVVDTERGVPLRSGGDPDYFPDFSLPLTPEEEREDEIRRFITLGRSAIGAPYRFGGGHSTFGNLEEDFEDFQSIKTSGADASGFFNAIRHEIGLKPADIGGVQDWFDFLINIRPFDSSKVYEPGTVLINPSPGLNGHMGIVSDWTHVLEANGHRGITNRLTISQSHSGWVGYTHVGEMPDLGVIEKYPPVKGYIDAPIENLKPFTTDEDTRGIDELSKEEYQLFRRINDSRIYRNLPYLKIDPRLNEKARIEATGVVSIDGVDYPGNQKSFSIRAKREYVAASELMSQYEEEILSPDVKVIGISSKGDDWIIQTGDTLEVEVNGNYENPITTYCDAVRINENEIKASFETPLGWHLVGEDKEMHYRVDAGELSSDFQEAASRWNALGGVLITPATGSRVDLVVSTGSLGGPGGRTYSDGKIVMDPSLYNQGTQNAKMALLMHELGHALGFPHTTTPSVMNTPVTLNSTSNNEQPTSHDVQVYRDTWGGTGSPGTGGSDDPGTGGSGDGGDGTQSEASAVADIPCIQRNPLGAFRLYMGMTNETVKSNFLRLFILTGGSYSFLDSPEIQEQVEFMGYDYTRDSFQDCEEVRDWTQLSEIYKEPYIGKIQEIKDSGFYTMQTLGTGEIVFWYPFIVQELKDYILERLKEQEEEYEYLENMTEEELEAELARLREERETLRSLVEGGNTGPAATTPVESEIMKAEERIKQINEEIPAIRKRLKEIREEIKYREELLSDEPIEETNAAILLKTIVVKDIELIDFHLNISDDPLVTHYYVMGDYRLEGAAVDTTVELACWRWSTIFEHPLFKRRDVEGKFDPDAFIYRYGSRPLQETKDAIKLPGFAQIWADAEFLKHWLSCYQISLDIAYMPEAYPGQRIRIESLGVECIIEQVSINFGNNWTTTIDCSMPLVIEDETKMPPLPFWSMVGREEAKESGSKTPDEEEEEREGNKAPEPKGLEKEPFLTPIGEEGDLDERIQSKREADAAYVQEYLRRWAEENRGK